MYSFSTAARIVGLQKEREWKNSVREILKRRRSLHSFPIVATKMKKANFNISHELDEFLVVDKPSTAQKRKANLDLEGTGVRAGRGTMTTTTTTRNSIPPPSHTNTIGGDVDGSNIEHGNRRGNGSTHGMRHIRIGTPDREAEREF
ncbi:hypothetical protein BD410DRAFT_839369 [Rickenella mellea]|uniref:Uncharacterized protein n=1 Tax=Rickenella mellea TaxID=50990 RepID=A0A4Y7Q8C4_9AGAM|nr:hypothetical protein BD410DRAFT_839369 [Rickenella mellea]